MLAQNSETQVAVENRKKLLFIDDDPSVIASLHLLFDADYNTFAANSVEEGLRLFIEVAPPLVILDLKLPDKSGLEALREIRKIDPSAAVLILTGFSTRLSAEESLRMGAVDYVNKPFDALHLKKQVAKLAESTQVRGESQDFKTLMEKSLQGLCEFREHQNASAAFLHDVAGPLSSLMAGSDLLSHKINEKDDITSQEIVEVVAMMDDSVRYLRALVEQWRSFSDLHVLMNDKCEVQKAIDLSVGQVMEQLSSTQVVFEIHAQRGSFYVPGNHFAIARVLINLMKNSYEAVSHVYGRIRLTVRSNDHSLEFVISDNGPGICPSQIPKLFTPYFTTKATGHEPRRGLGLFISQKIIQAVGGSIGVRSPGAMLGTDFTITLPRV